MKPVLRIPALAALLILFAGASLAAQSNERVDELLLQAKARLDSTAYIVLSAGGLIQESDAPAIAFEKAKSLNLLDNSLVADSPVSVQQLSYLLMKSLDLKGGLFYSIFPGTRYAYREMVFAKIVSDSSGPLKTLSGEEVIRALGYAMAQKGGAK